MYAENTTRASCSGRWPPHGGAFAPVDRNAHLHRRPGQISVQVIRVWDHRYSGLHNWIEIVYYCVLCYTVTMHVLCIKYAYDITSCVPMYYTILKGTRKLPCELTLAAKLKDVFLIHVARNELQQVLKGEL